MARKPLSGSSGNTIYLDQYTTAGVYVSSLMVPDEAMARFTTLAAPLAWPAPPPCCCLAPEVIP